MVVRPGPARTLAWGATLVLVSTLIVGCAAPPQKEMDQAEGAITTARAAGAAEYAPQEFEAAATALKRSHEAAAQRDYRQALNHAIDARERAEVAAREAADKRAVARGQAERAITAAELALATAQQRLQGSARAPGTGGRRSPIVAALPPLKDATAAATARLQEARSHLQAQRYGEAMQAAAPVTATIQAAVAAFDQALVAPPAPRTGRRGR